MRKLTEIEVEVFTYLNRLRESGVTNMFGAVPYIQNVYPELSQNTARNIHSLWMEHFNDEGNYSELQISQ